MNTLKFQYDGKWYVLREDGKVKRDDRFFYRKGWVVNGFVFRDEEKEEVHTIKTHEVFELLRNTPDSQENPIKHLKGAMINGSTGGQEGFKDGRPIEFIYAE